MFARRRYLMVEILILVSEKGRVELEPDAEKWVHAALARVPLSEAPLTQEVALATARVSLPHRDPADRFLAATARAYGEGHAKPVGDRLPPLQAL
jgi:PIN domain nuclease of toxin-antitoxin system